MTQLWFLSDHHFGHDAMYRFTDANGKRVRERFSCSAEGDEFMVEAHNKLVKPQDHVYFMGDVAMRREKIDIVRRMNGHKRLLFGNHDIFDYGVYLKAGFKKLMACRVMDGMIFTHIPIHPNGLGRFKCNVHGHLHANVVMIGTSYQPDPRFISCCVERRDYAPVPLEQLQKEIKDST